MKSICLGACLLMFQNLFFAQTPLSSVINEYTKVTSIEACEGRLGVTDVSGFQVGDHVLLIQMKGATINESDSNNFGDVTDYGGAGLFERNEIAAINGAEILLKYTVSNSYDVNGAVQLVSIPVFENATVTEPVTAYEWDGEKGGVLIFQVNATLTLEASINVSAQGFRGAQTNVQQSNCNFLTNANGYFYSLSNWRGAPKGEGIAGIIAGKEQGRGAQANGGGGGNDHNSGGGGGSNISAGGSGGKQSAAGLTCNGEFPGRGGKALANEPDRLFMGGGGGAGHDNNGTGTAGGRGGGIAIIIAAQIVANGQSIFANGLSVSFPNAGGDGAGGGGGGGTILLDAEEIVGELGISAEGGSGGNVNNPSNRCMGAGGGGGGGRFVSNLNDNINLHLEGNLPGVNLVASGQCSDPANGATAGADGLQTPYDGIPASDVLAGGASILAQPESQSVCENSEAVFEVELAGSQFSFQWQANDGTGWMDLQNGAIFDGANSPVLEIMNALAGMDGYQFRLLIDGLCVSGLLSEAAVLNVEPAPVPLFSVNDLGANTFQFSNNSQNAVSYFWDFGDGLTSTDFGPTHTYEEPGIYEVTLTASNDCGEIAATQSIEINAAPTAGFSVSAESGCAPFEVQFFNESTNNADNLEWQFPGGSPSSSSDENPVVVYNQAGEYGATLIVGNAQGSDTLFEAVAVEVAELPNVNFQTAATGLTVQFSNLSTNATGGFFWDFGDNTSSSELDPQHVYAMPGSYEVTLTAFNDCGEISTVQTLNVGTLLAADFAVDFLIPCAPAIVQFSDQSAGAGINSYLWLFDGGAPATSNQQNPLVTYEEPGVYDVSLIIENDFGADTLLLEDNILVEATPAAGFDFTVDEMSVSFTNNSVGGTFWNWDFGDGQSSTEFEPTHVYGSGGTFEVSLTVGNQSCGSALSRDVFVETPNAAGEQFLVDDLVVYPSPFGDFLKIEMENGTGKIFDVSLFDAFGRLVKRKESQRGNVVFETADLPEGVYWVTRTEVRASGKDEVRAVMLLRL
ncbi:MAG TPA: PKD domain-containing protein [Bacteroidetes bacterium]|nr:PKD domain-containing protein [Bacteroidota bacterium]